MFKLKWEMTKIDKLYKYSNADPMQYKNTTQIIPNSQIPDEDWKKVEKEDDISIMSQFKTLKRWEESDYGFVRNVKLYKMVNKPKWEEIES